MKIIDKSLFLYKNEKFACLSLIQQFDYLVCVNVNVKVADDNLFILFKYYSIIKCFDET